MTEDVKIEVEGCLVGAGVLVGSMVKVAVTLDDLFEAIATKALCDELHERAGNSDPVALEAYASIADDYGDRDPDIDPEPAIERLSDWDKAELLKALREDDGRRAIDVLKRAAA